MKLFPTFLQFGSFFHPSRWFEDGRQRFAFALLSDICKTHHFPVSDKIVLNFSHPLSFFYLKLHKSIHSCNLIALLIEGPVYTNAILNKTLFFLFLQSTLKKSV